MEVKTRRRRGLGKPKIDDIARAAGVSTATVSRALNDSPLVSPALKKLVEAHALRLGYVQHGAARALASNQSRTVGALIPTLKNAIFAGSVEAFERRLNESSYTLLVAISNYNPGQEVQQVRRLLERGVDGLMLIGNSHDSAVFDMVNRAGIPIVVTYAYDPRSAIPNVGFDNRTAAQRITEYLIGLGHRRIAVAIGITAGNDRATERLAGIRSALSAAGIALPPEYLIEVPYTIEAGRQALTDFLSLPWQPTAVICGNDVLALGVILEAADRAIQVPEQLSVTGFDNLPLTAHVRPTITTISVPSTEMGVQAADALLGVLNGTRPRAESLCLDAPLLVRSTTAPPPRGTKKHIATPRRQGKARKVRGAS